MWFKYIVVYCAGTTGLGGEDILLTVGTRTVQPTITILTLEHGLMIDVQRQCSQSVRNDACFHFIDETTAQCSATV